MLSKMRSLYSLGLEFEYAYSSQPQSFYTPRLERLLGSLLPLLGVLHNLDGEQKSIFEIMQLLQIDYCSEHQKRS